MVHFDLSELRFCFKHPCQGAANSESSGSDALFCSQIRIHVDTLHIKNANLKTKQNKSKQTKIEGNKQMSHLIQTLIFLLCDPDHFGL